MVTVVASAPTLNKGQVPGASVGNTAEYYRDKRSQYGQYVSPCPYATAAASAPIPAIAPASYQVNVSPYHGYGYGYPVPHYRTAEMEQENEMLSFSDDHMPMARFGFVQPAAASSVHPAYVAPAPVTTGPVFGVFPNANTGGCSVPLLLSCQPSIVPGRVVQTQANYGGDSYRSMDAAVAPHHEAEELHHDQQIHEHLSAANEPTHTIAHQ